MLRALRGAFGRRGSKASAAGEAAAAPLVSAAREGTLLESQPPTSDLNPKTAAGGKAKRGRAKGGAKAEAQGRAKGEAKGEGATTASRTSAADQSQALALGPPVARVLPLAYTDCISGRAGANVYPCSGKVLDERARWSGKRDELLEILFNHLCRASKGGEEIGGLALLSFVNALNRDEENDPIDTNSIVNAFSAVTSVKRKKLKSARKDDSAVGLDYTMFLQICGVNGLEIPTDALERAVPEVKQLEDYVERPPQWGFVGSGEPGQQEERELPPAAKGTPWWSSPPRRASTKPTIARPKDETVPQAVERLKVEMGRYDGRMPVFICVLGSTTFSDPDSNELCQAMGKMMSLWAWNRPVVFITGGCSGVQEVFSASSREGSKIYHLQPEGQRSGLVGGTDVVAGSNGAEKKEILGLLGDIYVTVEGGPGVAHEAMAGWQRQCPVIPVIRSGGASSGMFNFPAEAMERPAYTTEDRWSLLSDKEAPVEATAEALTRVIGDATRMVPWNTKGLA